MRIALDSLASKDDYPRGYEVRVSDDGEKWSEPIVTGKGCFWSFNEMAVYGRPEGGVTGK